MKRTKEVNLPGMRKQWRPFAVAPVTAAISAGLLAGCSDPKEEAKLYHTLYDCKTDNPSYEAQCEAAYESALKEAARTAPKFMTQRDCVAEFGQNSCISAPENNWFMPAMAGFMFARLLEDKRSYSGGRGYYSQPMFSSSYPSSRYYGRWTTADGYDFGSYRYKNAKVIINKDQMKPKPTVSRTISRGGFGSSAAAKSSWSSKSSSSSSSSRSWGG
ncbi:DUF1190 family protein [Photobacterium galatheae]|uniref:Uncharacterized protein n=1 Tax=Photobacterium galatheae TaxID=1654360 RepID=A0A066RHD2_9GAMM|nr:DUF1190 family protein [Photobacterium galatheae]KDM89860.1 hypothetical protein EA58_20635 [Photobacterium galatheae]MCM0151155.1 DUF1190 family protein [Photobacterium galatheae]